MRKDVAEKWAAALESGKYAQTTSALCRTKSMPRPATDGESFAAGLCCLGVLCELAIESGVDLPRRVDDGGLVHYGVDEETTILPREVRYWAGIGSNTGVVRDPRDHQRVELELTVKNDGGATFEEIAALVRQNAEEL